MRKREMKEKRKEERKKDREEKGAVTSSTYHIKKKLINIFLL